jgi:hypothetical protein
MLGVNTQGEGASAAAPATAASAQARPATPTQFPVAAPAQVAATATEAAEVMTEQTIMVLIRLDTGQTWLAHVNLGFGERNAESEGGVVALRRQVDGLVEDSDREIGEIW